MQRQHSSGIVLVVFVLGIIALGALLVVHDSPQPVAPPDPPGEVLTGRVEHVFDGDTIRLVNGDRKWRIRLQGIDAPEWKQAYGDASRDYLSKLCGAGPIRVVVVGRDRYHRVLGDVYSGDKWINGLMVEAGYAWQWARGQDAAQLKRLQQHAIESRRGLWADARPIPPWEFRSMQGSGQPALCDWVVFRFSKTLWLL